MPVDPAVVDRAISFVLGSIEAKRSAAERVEMAQTANKMLEDDDLFAVVRERFLAIPPQAVGHLDWGIYHEGRVWEIILAVRDKYRDQL